MGISGNFTMLWFHNAHFVPVAGSVRNGLAGGYGASGRLANQELVCRSLGLGSGKSSASFDFCYGRRRRKSSFHGLEGKD
jgi:hypothetical protein